MTSTRIIFLLTIATSIYLVNAVDILSNLKKALSDAEDKLGEIYGPEKVNDVEAALDKAGDKMVEVITDTAKEIQGILGLTAGNIGEVENKVQGVNGELENALNGVKNEIGQIFHAAKKGAKKAYKKLNKGEHHLLSLGEVIFVVPEILPEPFDFYLSGVTR